MAFKRKRNTSSQHGTSFSSYLSKGTQTENVKSSYGRDDKTTFTTYNFLKDEVLCNREATLSWCRENCLIANTMKCPTCGQQMTLRNCNDRKDGLKWECRQSGSQRHREEVSERQLV